VAGELGVVVLRRFAEEGARVVANDGDARSAKAAVHAVAAEGHEVVAAPGDCAEPAQAQATVDAALEAFGGLDIISVNHPTTEQAAFHTLQREAWQRALAATVTVTEGALRAGVSVLRERAKAELATDRAVAHQRKLVVSVPPEWMTGEPGMALHSASAGALIGLTRTLARELGPFGINVNAVVCGALAPSASGGEADSGGAVANPGADDPRAHLSDAMTALGRRGRPEEIAAVHAFLASADADYVTGAAIPVTGGALGTLA
jgi:3-oxoacyl-[acyl-carrier protein] reductase